jgi:cytoskeletal protein CcmA (bactofilin family)
VSKQHPLSGYLGPGSSWSGDLSFEGRLRIDGDFRGRIYSEGLLELGHRGHIEGEVDVARAVIAGTVDGRLQARESLVVEATATVRGEVLMRRIRVAQGASVEAKVRRIGVEPR